MTPKELYEWAVEHGAEDYDLVVSRWTPERGLAYDLPGEGCVWVDKHERIIIDL